MSNETMIALIVATVGTIAAVLTAVFTGWANRQRKQFFAAPMWKPVVLTSIWRDDNEKIRNLRLDIANIGDGDAYDVLLELRETPPLGDGVWRVKKHHVRVMSGEPIWLGSSAPPVRMPDHVKNRFWSGVAAYFDLTNIEVRVKYRHRPGMHKVRTETWANLNQLQETMHIAEEVPQSLVH